MDPIMLTPLLTTTSEPKSTYLPSFKILNGNTYLDEASKGSASAPSDPSAPTLIILCSWLNANPRHIAKFTAYYRTLYPSTPLLLVTSSTASFLPVFASIRRARFAPAVSTVRAYADSPSPTPGRDPGGSVLAHAFSNGGCGQLAFLAKQYRETAGKPLPVGAIVYDSCPGAVRLWQGATAFSLTLPRAWYVQWPARGFFAAFILLFYMVPALFGGANLAQSMRAIANSVRPSYLRSGAKRWYVYSKEDAQIWYRDVEDHAEEGKARGIPVEMVRFEGSTHVAHMRMDPERYWGVVRRAWEERK